MKTDLLLFSENCGSSWLCELLGNFPEIAHVDFEPLFYIIDKFHSDSYYSNLPINQYLEAILPEVDIEKLILVRASIGLPAYSDLQLLKLSSASRYLIKIRAHELYCRYARLAQWSNSNLIYLKRSSQIRQIISIYKRRILGISHFENFELTPPIFVEKSRFLLIAEQISILNASNEQFYSEWVGSKMCIFYEDLLNEQARTLATIGVHFGYSVEILSNNTYFRKITSDNLSGAVKNVDDMLVWLDEYNTGIG